MIANAATAAGSTRWWPTRSLQFARLALQEVDAIP